MNKSGLKALLGDLKDAKVGTRELSDKCLLAAGWERTKIVNWIKDGRDLYIWKPPDWENKFLDHGIQPDPSCNTQDALDWMVPEGWHLENMRTGITAFATLYFNDRKPLGPAGWPALAATLPLAICIARIKLELDKLDE